MDSYKQNIDQHDVISFDIFDTLLSRNVSAPADVFTITHELFNQESDFTLQDDFRPLRINAERRARLNKTSADVTLDDIYDHLKELRPDYPESILETLKKFELKAETSSLVRGRAASLYDYARSRGKKVAIVSDMYLPKRAIEQFLHKNNISGWDFLLVSCDDHLSKASGTAFVALHEQFPGASVLHIGDNYHDDIVMAQQNGIDAQHIQSTVEVLRNSDTLNRYFSVWERRVATPETVNINEVGQSVIDGLVAKYVAEGANGNERIGFAVLGPLLLGFSQWLHESLQADGCDKVLFLARDGNIMHKAYNLIYGKDAVANEYIFGSRRALVFPSLRVLSGEDIRTFAQLDRGANLSATLDTFNLSKSDPAVKAAAKKAGVKLSENNIDSSNAPRVEAMLLSLKEKILVTISDERKVVLRYLQSVGYDKATSKVAVCDIGWNGSVRTVIEGYVGREVPGYYLGLRNVEKTQHVGDKIKGYFDARKDFDWKEFAPVVAGGVEVIELLFSNPDQGPIRKIELNENGEFIAPENKHDFPEEQREMIRQIQSSALAFIKAYQEAYRNLPKSLWTLDRHSGLSGVVSLIDDPTESSAFLIGTAPYSTSVGSRPELIGAPTRSNLYYRTHFRSLKKEWSRSFWGQGFKKNARARGLKRHGL